MHKPDAPAPPSLFMLDSGIGGLSIVRAVRLAMPSARIAYLADNAGFPYGAWRDAALTRRVIGLVGAGIARFAPDVVVLPCNTASTIALGALREAFPLPFVGCVPAVKWAASISRTGVFGVLATAATARRAYLQELIDRFAPDKTVLSHGAPGLAGLAERKFRGEAVPVAAVRDEIAPLLVQPGAERMDTVVLGCTHFAFLLEELHHATARDITWLDPAGAVARQVARVADGVGRSGGIGADVALLTAPDADAALHAGFAAHGFRAVEGFAVPAEACC